MPLKKILLKPGVNRENTRYTNEGGWYESDKIRFRQGTPEKIGGWQRISSSTFLGICRSLWNWVTLGGLNLVGVGTNIKFYLESGGAYNDITPFRAQYTLTDPFQTFAGSPIVEVTDANGGFIDGDYVTFYGGTSVGGLTFYGEYQITVTSATTYTITASSNASADAIGGGTVYALYQINVGPAIVVPLIGWGAGPWGAGEWGIGQSTDDSLRLWSQSNFGEDLIFGPRGGGIYYWDASTNIKPVPFTATVASPTVISVSTGTFQEGEPIRFAPDSGSTLPVGITPGAMYYVRNPSGILFNISATPSGPLIAVSGAAVGVCKVLSNAYAVKDFGGATDVPTHQNYLLVSDVSRFTFAFGCNDYGSPTIDPMLIRWSDQEDPYNWTPAPTNQAGFLRLSRGSNIVSALQSRQEILVWTDSSVYSLQYVGAPIVWGAQLVGDNISIAGENAVTYANGVSYWMGNDKFYKYDGRTQTLRCDLRKYIFEDINTSQLAQVCAGTNEGYNEVWWFYCSANSTEVDKYVVYNYAEDIWYYGTMGRTAWLDTGVRDVPIAATYANNLVNHETGNDDGTLATELPITASITSAEFDLEDGHQFMFVWRVLPDITFAGSTSVTQPSATMYLLPLKNSGSGYSVNPGVNENHSVANQSYSNITRIATLPIEEFTGQIFTRVRARQMAMKIESTGLGVNWQLGAPRIDMRPDGRR